MCFSRSPARLGIAGLVRGAVDATLPTPSKSASLAMVVLIASGGAFTMRNILICCDDTDDENSANISSMLKLYRCLHKKTRPR